MCSTGGNISNKTLIPLALSMDQMLRPETPLEITRPQQTDNAYSTLLEKERDKLLGTGPASTFYAPETNAKAPKPSKLDLRPNQMLGATPSDTNYIPDTLVTPEKVAAFNKGMAELHPFGPPPTGWMPKDQVMSIVRQIDKAYRAKSTEAGK